MFYLEDGLNKEAFRVAVIAAKRKHFADNAAAWLTFNMDDKIDSFRDLGFGIGERALRVTAHHEIGETVKGFLRGVSVDRSHRTRMARVEGIEQRPCLDSADFPENDAVRSPAESGLWKVKGCYRRSSRLNKFRPPTLGRYDPGLSERNPSPAAEWEPPLHTQAQTMEALCTLVRKLICAMRRLPTSGHT